MFTLRFDQPESTEKARTGGKGANLALLTQAGFDVPPGFTVTTTAYSDFLTANKLDETIAGIVAAINYDDADQLESSASKIRRLMLDADMPENVADALNKAYAEIGSDSFVAVRSSGTAEDLAEASFAGQHDTHLDIRGAEALLDAVKRCWASLWTARATGYRERNGFDQLEARLAVVVQKMVPSEVSGVMFTGNPLTTANDEIVINAAWGLGEAVVAGLVTPDTYVVHAKNLRVKERQVGSKAIQIVRDHQAGVGTLSEDVPHALQAVLCLPDDQLMRLADLGRRVQAHYVQFPQDIEWGYAGGEFYLLQSRPITGVAFSWDDAVTFENGTRDEDDETVWTRSFADEVITGGTTPLNYTARIANYERTYQFMARGFGFDDLVKTRLFKYYKGETYYNCNWDRTFIERTTIPALRAPTLAFLPTSWRQDVLAHPFKLLPYAQALARAVVTEPAKQNYMKRFALWRTDPVRRQRATGLTYDELARLSDADLKKYIRTQVDVELEWFDENMFGFFVQWRDALSLMPLLISKWYDGPNDMVSMQLLMGTVERTDTQIENIRLWEFAQQIRNSPVLRATYDQHQDRAFFTALRDTEEGRAFLVGYDEFLTTYAHRGHADRDLYYPRRSEDPSLDYRAIGVLLGADIPEPHEQERHANRTREAALQEVLQNVRSKTFGSIKAEIIKALFTFIHKFLVARDCERQMPADLIQMSVKRGFVEIGRRLRERGLLEGERDIYFLTVDELYELLDGRDNNLPLVKAKVAARARDFERRINREVTPPKNLQGGKPVQLEQAITDGQEGVFQGAPTSSGTVTGTARIIKNIGEINQVQPGEILIVNSTDPGWTPVFLIIKAVVVETGGMLSHASCLAREYGFPAVQLEGALDLIPDGSTITVDGFAGTVTIVDE